MGFAYPGPSHDRLSHYLVEAVDMYAPALRCDGATTTFSELADLRPGDRVGMTNRPEFATVYYGVLPPRLLTAVVV